MKRFFALALLATTMLASCADDYVYNSEGQKFGTLSLTGLDITVTEDVDIVRATEADQNYLIYIYDSEGQLYNNKPFTYGDIKNGSNGEISLPEGTYRLEARSASTIPTAEWEAPVYGVTHNGITITAGETTHVGTLTCRLLQCKVTVDYNDDFLAMVAGDCKVDVTIGGTLTYEMTLTNGVPTYTRDAGYFDVNNDSNTTMEVKFVGVIKDEKTGNITTQRMTKGFEGIGAAQWRMISFVKKVIGEGNVTFDIVINDYVEDTPIGEDITGTEEAIGPDPNAPKGDGNIKLLSTAGLNENTSPTQAAWNASFTDDPLDTESYEVIVLDDNLTAGTDDSGNPIQLLQFEASVPNKIKDFYVVIESETISPLLPALIGDAEYIDLVHDTTAVKAIAEVVPFPYHDPENGVIIAGATSVAFNLDKAVGILRAMGSAEHTFKMTVRDESNYTKQIDLKFNVVGTSQE